jgi:hypothetical protein
VELLKNASEVIRHEDIQAKIIGICARNACPVWLKAVLDKDGAKYLDIVSFHSHAPITTLYQSAKSPVLAFRKILDGYEENIPLWNTEGGHWQSARTGAYPLSENDMLNLYPNRKTTTKSEPFINLWGLGLMLSEKRGASWLVKDILLQMADGTDKYFFNPGPSLYYPSYNNSDGDPSLKGIACATLASLLIPAKEISRIENLTPETAGINIKSDDKETSLFFSCGQGQELVLKVQEANKVFHGMDILGNPLIWTSDENANLKLKLSSEPVYITNLKLTK